MKKLFLLFAFVILLSGCRSSAISERGTPFIIDGDKAPISKPEECPGGR